MQNDVWPRTPPLMETPEELDAMIGKVMDESEMVADHVGTQPPDS